MPKKLNSLTVCNGDRTYITKVK